MGFFCLLRPGELCALTVGDIKFDSSAVGSQAVVAIRDPKTSRWMGRSQFTRLLDQDTIKWLFWLCSSLPDNMKIWPSNTSRFRLLFSSLLKRCQINAAYTPASLRAGGATYFVLQGWELSRLMFHGRWRSPTTLSSYIQEAMSHYVWIGLGSETQARVLRIVEESASYWSTPPLAAWTSLFRRHRQWKSRKSTPRKWLRMPPLF